MNFKKNEYLESLATRFKEAVYKSFNFLINNYGYKLEKIEKDLYGETYNDPREIGMSIGFIKGKVSVEIFFYISGARIGVSFGETVCGKIPEKCTPFPLKKIPACVGLDTLIEMTNNMEKLPLHWKHINKRGKEIENNMEKILDKYAELLKKYGDEILKGNTSVFPKVQRFYKKKIDQEYKF